MGGTFDMHLDSLCCSASGRQNGHHILGGTILRHLGLSATWMLRAQGVMELLEKIGPGFPNLDSLVLEYISSGIVTHKGLDLLVFLQAQA